jgi:hypothetical protein
MKHEREEAADKSSALDQPLQKKRAHIAEEAHVEAEQPKDSKQEHKTSSKPAVDVDIALEKLSKFLTNPKKIEKAVELTINLVKVSVVCHVFSTVLALIATVLWSRYFDGALTLSF